MKIVKGYGIRAVAFLFLHTLHAARRQVFSLEVYYPIASTDSTGVRI